MLEEYPLMNAYWESKIPEFEKITIPVYITAGWNHIHLRGAMNAFMKIRSPKKWLRIHREFEWPDAYMWWNLEDLKRFFDRYLKGIRNGWEATPPVRIDVMDAYDYDFQVARPEREFPLARTQYQKLYLDAADSRSFALSRCRPSSKASYDADEGRTTFDITFDEDVELTGYAKVRLWVEADGNDEMDLFITVMKLDENGRVAADRRHGAAAPGPVGQAAGVPACARPRAFHRLPAGAVAPDAREAQARRDRARRHRLLSLQPHLAQGPAAAAADRRPLLPGGLVRALHLGPPTTRVSTSSTRAASTSRTCRSRWCRRSTRRETYVYR